jgi:serine/threonine-protein kinase
MSETAESRFAAKALDLAYLTREQVRSALERLAEKQAQSPETTLADLLVSQGLLTSEQVREVRRELGEDPNMIRGFEILEKIGQGGMGVVYRARQMSMRRIVALKVMLRDFARDRTHVERFLREARAAAKLTHPNLVAAFDAGESDGRYYLAMEFVEGTSLRNLIQLKKRLDESLVLKLGRDAALALEKIHAAGLVHRDVKPENLMITPAQTAKLCDFGLARPVAGTDVSLTATGLVVGTPLYCSPEQVRGDKKIDIRSDLYSLGCTLYHALCGRPPFIADTAGNLCYQHLTRDPAPPRSLNPAISESTQGILLKLLKKNPAERYGGPAELRADLEAVLKGARIRPPRTTTIRRHRPAAVSPPRAPLIVGGVVAVVLVGLVVALSSGSRTAARTRPPPPSSSPVELPVTPPVAPPPDPLETEASNALAEAELLYAGKKYDAARARLEEIQSRFAGVPQVREKLAEISRMLADCKLQIQSRLDRFDRSYDEALTLMRRAEWSGAKEKLLALIDQGLETPRVSKSSLASGLKTCDREIGCGEDLATLEKKMDDKRWRDAAALMDSLAAKHRETTTLAAVRAEMDSWRARSSREITAEEALFRVRGEATQKNWDQVLAAIVELQAYGDTATLRDAQKEIDGLKTQAQKQIELANKGALQAAWDHSMRLLRAQSWEEAVACLRNMRSYYGETEFFKQREAEWKAAMDKADLELRKGQDAKADKLWKTAQAFRAKGNYENALDCLKGIVREFSETGWFKRNATAVKRAMIECQEKARPAEPAVPALADFENGIGEWVPDTGGNVAAPRVVEAEGYESKRAARLTFARSGGPGAWASTYMRISGLDREAVGIKFWARSATDRQTTARLALVEWQGPGGKEVYVSSFTVGPKWQQVSVEFASMTLSWGQGNRALDADRVGGLGFDMGDGSAEIDLIVDRIEYLYKPK